MEKEPDNMMQWLAKAKILAAQILDLRGGKPLDVDALIASDQDEQEERDRDKILRREQP